MGLMLKKIIAVFFIFVLQGNIIFGTFYSPYNFNRHLSHFQRKNYQFWHELYRNNYEPQPFLRYSQPGYISPGSLQKLHSLDAVPYNPSQNTNNNNYENSNVNNNQNQWSAMNDVYGYGFRHPNLELADENVLTSSTVPPTKRTTRPRTTYTTKERTTVSLSTEATTRPTIENGAGNEITSTTTVPNVGSTSKPTKSPSQLLAQIAQINNSSQGILGQLGKPTRTPGSGGSRPSASQLLQQIQKVNSSAQHLLVTLKPNTKLMGLEIKDEMVWTTARTSSEQEEPNIPVIISDMKIELKESHPIATPTTVLKPDLIEEVEVRNATHGYNEEKVETTTNILKTEENPTSSESIEKMVLVSTSNKTEEDIESRHTDLDLSESSETEKTQTSDYESTTDLMQKEQDELDNRHEEYDIESSGSTEKMGVDTSDMEQTTVKSNENNIKAKSTDKAPEAEERFDTQTTIMTDLDENEIETLSEIIDTTSTIAQTDVEIFEEDINTTTTDMSEVTTIEPGNESDVDQELIEFILVDIITTASALQNVVNTILNPFGVSLSPEFFLLEALLISARESGNTTPEAANKIGIQITKITSNIGLKRLRSTKILELTQRLTKLSKILKLSVSNAS